MKRTVAALLVFVILFAPATVMASTGYLVRPGDTLWLISQRHNTTVSAILQANNLANPNYIEVGWRLTIPAPAPTPAPAPQQPLPSRGGFQFSAAELDLFARLVHAEAAGEPYLGQVAVAATVLNRINSTRYPNTLSAVIYQIESGFYQYSPVLDGRINLPAGESARRAVRDAIAGQDPSLGAIGFYNPRKTSNVWVRQQPVTTIIGNHVFFR
jgi:N-acetylmuramoyl-L-alanine amidase